MKLTLNEDKEILESLYQVRICTWDVDAGRWADGCDVVLEESVGTFNSLSPVMSLTSLPLNIHIADHRRSTRRGTC